MKKHSQQTMNQDSKISSVRRGIINIELGLYLCVIILQGPKKRRWFTDYSQHIPKITASRCALQ